LNEAASWTGEFRSRAAQIAFSISARCLSLLFGGDARRFSSRLRGAFCSAAPSARPADCE
jgi:hypothetical protein